MVTVADGNVSPENLAEKAGNLTGFQALFAPSSQTSLKRFAELSLSPRNIHRSRSPKPSSPLVEELRSYSAPSEAPSLKNGRCAIDPVPLGIIQICFGALQFAGAVAVAYISYKKYFRDEEHREQDLAAEFLAQTDKLRAAGVRLLNVIMLVRQNGETAFRMTARLHYVRSDEETPAGDRTPSLRISENCLEIDFSERERWNTLVATAAQSVETMNKAVETYEEALSNVLALGRKIENLIGVSLESVIGNVVDRSIDFQKALDSFQTLRATSSINEAERRFARVVYASEAMVGAANGFATLCRQFYEVRTRKR